MKGKTVFVFGAGSTAELNIPLSEGHVKIFAEAADKNELLGKLYSIVSKKFANKNYNINDVFNLIDTALQLQIGLSIGEDKIEYLDLLRAKSELIACILNKFTSIIQKTDYGVYRKYVDFYYKLAKAELNAKINGGLKTDDKRFFISDYSIVNFNWDLYSLFPVIEAHAKLNRENGCYFLNGKLPKLRMYTDFNYECASPLSDGMPWYPFTEPAAHIVNGDKYDATRRVVLTKTYFPHGLMNSFKCPKCARHSLFLGDLKLKSVYGRLNYSSETPLYNCVYCGAKISAKNFNVLTQSNFKTRNAFLEETRIKMFCELESAERLVFIGYSMPEDDVDYKTFFKSLYNVKEVFVVLKDDNELCDFKEVTDSDSLIRCAENTESVLRRYVSVFKKVYVNTCGFPTAADDILSKVL